MNVYDQAHGLAQAIKNSEEFKQFDEIKKQIDSNEEVSNMIKDFQTKQLELQTKQMMGEEMGQEAIQSIQNLYAIIAKDPLAAKYLESQMRFSVMMKDVYDIIGKVIDDGGLF